MNNQAQSKQATNLPFLVEDRRLIQRGARAGQLETLHLEGVRDDLRRQAAAQDAEDIERPLRELVVDFTGGHMKAFWLNPTGRGSEEYLLAKTGAGDLARDILPSRFWSGLRHLALLDDGGAKVASAAWAKLALAGGTDPRLVRTINMRMPGGEVRRVIRSVHSQGYAAYSNLQFVEDLLAHAGELANLPVLQWSQTDNVMRLRFAGIPADEISLRTPVPMYEAWNSETGRRSVGLRGGMWKLVCTNGMGSWDEKTEWRWRHYGETSRIRDGVKDAFQSLKTVASGVIHAYEDALNTNIDNIYSFLQQELAGVNAPQRIIQASLEGVKDPTTTPGSTLASAVDAVTLIAQKETDLLLEYEIERWAARMMDRGLARAEHGRILVNA